MYKILMSLLVGLAIISPAIAQEAQSFDTNKDGCVDRTEVNNAVQQAYPNSSVYGYNDELVFSREDIPARNLVAHFDTNGCFTTWEFVQKNAS